MKNGIFFSIFTAMVILGCNRTVQQETPSREATVPEKVVAVGGSKDSLGCLVSAGESWSQLEQQCIRPFESGFRLNPVDKVGDSAIISAFILISQEGNKAELFLPEDESNNVILESDGKGFYVNQLYKYNSHTSKLYKNDDLVYYGNIE